MPTDHPRRASVLGDPILFAATGGGLGLLQIAPGTMGAALGLICVPLLWSSTGWWGSAFCIGCLCALGVPVCGYAAARLEQKDPSAVIWDEFCTVPMVFLAVPVADALRVQVLLVGFGLHRFFDICKPPPVDWLERFPHGWGIMLDDCAAALYGMTVLWALVAAGFV